MSCAHSISSRVGAASPVTGDQCQPRTSACTCGIRTPSTLFRIKTATWRCRSRIIASRLARSRSSLFMPVVSIASAIGSSPGISNRVPMATTPTESLYGPHHSRRTPTRRPDHSSSAPPSRSRPPRACGRHDSQSTTGLRGVQRTRDATLAHTQRSIRLGCGGTAQLSPFELRLRVEQVALR